MSEKIEHVMEQLRQGMEWGLKEADKNGASDAEAFGITLKLTKLVKMGEKLDFSSGIFQGISFRVLKDGSMGFSFMPSHDRTEIERAIRDAIKQAEVANQQLGDYHFPSKQNHSNFSMPLDSELHEAPPDLIAELHERLTISRNDPRLPSDVKPIGTGTIFFSYVLGIMNGSGIDVEMRTAYCILGAYFLSIKGFPAYDGHYEGSHYLKELNPESVIDKAIVKTQEVAAPKTLNRQGSFPVIIHSDALGISYFGNMLDLFTESLKGNNVCQGTTPFSKEQLGEEIASSDFTLQDDPWRPNMLNTMQFDGEGVPTHPTTLIENGVLKDFYLDSLHAKRLAMENNAKSIRIRGDFGATAMSLPPQIGTTNTIIQSGDASLDEIISETKEGFMINRVMGVHMSDFSTGRFSVGASGWYIKNGEVKFPLQELTVNGIMPQVLKDIDFVSKEQERGVNAIVPHVRVSTLKCIAVKRPLFMRLGFRIYKILLLLGIVKHPLLS